MGYLETAIALLEDLGSQESQDSEETCALSALSAETPSEPLPWTPRPAELATWPVEWRERWGQRANALADQGVAWPDDERQAFVEVKGSFDGTVAKAAEPRSCFLACVTAPVGLIPFKAIKDGLPNPFLVTAVNR